MLLIYTHQLTKLFLHARTAILEIAIYTTQFFLSRKNLENLGDLNELNKK